MEEGVGFQNRMSSFYLGAKSRKRSKCNFYFLFDSTVHKKRRFRVQNSCSALKCRIINTIYSLNHATSSFYCFILAGQVMLGSLLCK